MGIDPKAENVLEIDLDVADKVEKSMKTSNKIPALLLFAFIVQMIKLIRIKLNID